jgi:hypothetical protein
MSTIQDVLRSWYIDALGLPVTTTLTNNDLELLFLQTETSATGSVNDLWLNYLTSLGITSGSINDRKLRWALDRLDAEGLDYNNALRRMFLEVPFGSSIPLPEENLLALYDWTTTSATPTTWNDSSGNGNNLTAVGLTYKTAGSILLYGSYYQLAAGLLGGLAAGHTVYMKASVGGFLPSVLIEEVNVNRLELNASNQLRLSQSTSGTAYTHNSAGTTPTLATPEWAVINYVGGTDFNIYKNKTLVTPDTTGPAGNLGNNANAFNIGNSGAWIDIKCVAIYSVAHDTSTRESIIDTINSVWV